MEKKRSVGVTISALIMLIYSFVWFFDFMERFTVFNKFTCYLIGATYLILSMLILNLKQPGRIFAIYISVFMGGFTLFILLEYLSVRFLLFPQLAGLSDTSEDKIRVIYSILNLLIALVFIFFFTRPKVKEQFKPGGPNA